MLSYLLELGKTGQQSQQALSSTPHAYTNFVRLLHRLSKRAHAHDCDPSSLQPLLVHLGKEYAALLEAQDERVNQYDQQLLFLMEFTTQGKQQKPSSSSSSQQQQRRPSLSGVKLQKADQLLLSHRAQVVQRKRATTLRNQLLGIQQSTTTTTTTTTSAAAAADDETKTTTNSSKSVESKQSKQQQRQQQPAEAEEEESTIRRLFAGVDKQVRGGVEVVSQEDDLALQEQLTSQISQMAGSLRENVLQIQKSLRVETQMLEGVEDLIESHIPKVESQTKDLTEHMRSSTKSTIATYLMLVVVVGLFFATYLIIKLTPAASR